jgi:hypothetical protein
MSFVYTILPPPLHATADAAMKWFMDNWGISKGAVTVEGEIHHDVELRPTLSAPSQDHHLLCVEASESVYANHLNASVIGCVRHGLPVKLYVAVPKNAKDPNYAQNLRAAKRAGVGVIEIDGSSGIIVQNALSLSLSAVRPIDVQRFPKKYRHNLTHAQQTFRDGTPEKACSLVYDEIESLFRKAAKRTFDKGWWPNSRKLKIDTAPWATLINDWNQHLDRRNCPCPALKQAFVARILGVTPYRNDTGHKPKDMKALIKRDQQLRTRFEDAVDLLGELIDATKPLKV